MGSGAPFGTVDILIPGQQNFLLRDASEFLKSYFPTVPVERLHMLLNNQITTFNPEAIIIPSGRVPLEIYLLLAGKVEVLGPDPASSHFLFSGSMLAESSAIHNRPSQETYRSVGFVHALRLPSDLYRHFVDRFFSSTDLIEVRKIEDRLRRTYLFGDAVTNTTLFSLAKNCRVTHMRSGERFVSDAGILHLVGRGRLTQGEEEDAQVIGKGGFWGSNVLFGAVAEAAGELPIVSDVTPELVALDTCEIYSVPLEQVAQIPVVRWKLFEAFRNSHPYAAPRYRGTAR